MSYACQPARREYDRLINERARLILDGVEPGELAMPIHPCQIMPTRSCPPSYTGPCEPRPCARFESDDETPWNAQ